MSVKKKVTRIVLGLKAMDRTDVDGPVVVGDGRALKGRVEVASAERQRALCPPPSDETVKRIMMLESAVRRPGGRLGSYRFD